MRNGLRPQPTRRTSWKLVANPGWQPWFPTSFRLVRLVYGLRPLRPASANTDVIVKRLRNFCINKNKIVIIREDRMLIKV